MIDSKMVEINSFEELQNLATIMKTEAKNSALIIDSKKEDLATVAKRAFKFAVIDQKGSARLMKIDGKKISVAITYEHLPSLGKVFHISCIDMTFTKDGKVDEIIVKKIGDAFFTNNYHVATFGVVMSNLQHIIKAANDD